MLKNLYILGRFGRPKQCDDLMQWCSWFETSNRGLEYTVIKDANRKGIGGIHVSTVFLGIDHNFSQKGKPLLWETMVFGGPLSEHGERYSSAADAKKGHKRWVEAAHGKRPAPSKGKR